MTLTTAPRPGAEPFDTPEGITMEFLGYIDITPDVGESRRTGVYYYRWDSDLDADPPIQRGSTLHNAVSIGCPECEQNTQAPIGPSGGYYQCRCCGYEHELTEATLRIQGSTFGAELSPFTTIDEIDPQDPREREQ